MRKCIFILALVFYQVSIYATSPFFELVPEDSIFTSSNGKIKYSYGVTDTFYHNKKYYIEFNMIYSRLSFRQYLDVFKGINGYNKDGYIINPKYKEVLRDPTKPSGPTISVPDFDTLYTIKDFFVYDSLSSYIFVDSSIDVGMKEIIDSSGKTVSIPDTFFYYKYLVPLKLPNISIIWAHSSDTNKYSADIVIKSDNQIRFRYDPAYGYYYNPLYNPDDWTSFPWGYKIRYLGPDFDTKITNLKQVSRKQIIQNQSYTKFYTIDGRIVNNYNARSLTVSRNGKILPCFKKSSINAKLK